MHRIEQDRWGRTKRATPDSITLDSETPASPPKRHKKKQKKAKKQVAAAAEVQELLAQVLEASIPLPSTLPKQVLGQPSMKLAVDLERSERESLAAYHINHLRGHLITSFQAQSVARNVNGQDLMTRAQSAAHKKQVLVDRSAGDYRRCREALLNLGMNADNRTFKDLLDSDIKPFRAFGMDADLKGSSHPDREARRQENRKEQRSRIGGETPSWLWENWDVLNDVGDNEAMQKFFLEGKSALSV